MKNLHHSLSLFELEVLKKAVYRYALTDLYAISELESLAGRKILCEIYNDQRYLDEEQAKKYEELKNV